MGSQLVWRSCSDTVCDKRARSTGAEMKMDSARSLPEFVNETHSGTGWLLLVRIIGVSLNREIEVRRGLIAYSTKVARRVVSNQSYFSSNETRTRCNFGITDPDNNSTHANELGNREALI